MALKLYISYFKLYPLFFHHSNTLPNKKHYKQWVVLVEIMFNKIIQFVLEQMIYALFKRPDINIEANNMCRLFNSDYHDM